MASSFSYSRLMCVHRIHKLYTRSNISLYGLHIIMLHQRDADWKILMKTNGMRKRKNEMLNYFKMYITSRIEDVVFG